MLREGIYASTITDQSSREHRKQVIAGQRFEKDKGKFRRKEKERKMNETLEDKKINEWQREWAVKEDEAWANRRWVVTITAAVGWNRLIYYISFVTALCSALG